MQNFSYPGEKAVKAFVKAGWRVEKKESSNVILRKEDSSVTLSVPYIRS